MLIKFVFPLHFYFYIKNLIIFATSSRKSDLLFLLFNLFNTYESCKARNVVCRNLNLNHDLNFNSSEV